MSVNPKISLKDAVMLGARSGSFFGKYFLPESFTLKGGVYHDMFWDVLDDAESRYVGIEVFRDGGKTTMVRTAMLKAICYGVYRCILLVSESAGHSEKSLEWVRKKIERRADVWYQIFGIKIGTVANKERLDIIHDRVRDEHGNPITISLLAMGITGQIRGVNLDDQRPELIIGDDIANEENTNSPQACEKLNNLFFGSLQNCLASASMNKFARIILIGTRLNPDDPLAKAKADSQYKYFSFSVFTEDGKSSWESKWTTGQLLKDKQSAIERRQLNVWLREKEGKLVKSDQQMFVEDWLKIVPRASLPLQDMRFVISVDPVPPPSEKQIKEGYKYKDFEVWSVIGFTNHAAYLVEQVAHHGHNSNWSCVQAEELIVKYRKNLDGVGVESVGYQRTLAHLIREHLQKKGLYVPIHEIDDRRNKSIRIQDTLGTLGYGGRLVIASECVKFISEYINYPGVDHDDHLDSAAMAIQTFAKLRPQYFNSPTPPDLLQSNEGYIGDSNEADWPNLQLEDRLYGRLPTHTSGLAP